MSDRNMGKKCMKSSPSGLFFPLGVIGRQDTQDEFTTGKIHQSVHIILHIYCDKKTQEQKTNKVTSLIYNIEVINIQYIQITLSTLLLRLPLSSPWIQIPAPVFCSEKCNAPYFNCLSSYIALLFWHGLYVLQPLFHMKN